MEEYWDKFEKTGSIEDYLKYKGIELLKKEELEVGGYNETYKGERSSNQRDSL